MRVKECVSRILRIQIIQSACPNKVRVLVFGTMNKEQWDEWIFSVEILLSHWLVSCSCKLSMHKGINKPIKVKVIKPDKIYFIHSFSINLNIKIKIKATFHNILCKLSDIFYIIKNID